jgi:hypothetical protein
VGQIADRDRRDWFKIGGPKRFDLIQPADRDIGDLAAWCLHEVDVVGDRPGVDDPQHLKWRLGREHHRFADVFQGEPHLLAVRGGGDVGAERRNLFHASDDLVRFGADNDSFRREAAADISVFAVGREDRHARPVRNRDARFFAVCCAVEDGDIVLAAHRHPHLAAVLGKERFVRRASDISCVLDLVGGRIDEGDGIGGDRDDHECLAIRRETKPVDEHLALVER